MYVYVILNCQLITGQIEKDQSFTYYEEERMKNKVFSIIIFPLQNKRIYLDTLTDFIGAKLKFSYILA